MATGEPIELQGIELASFSPRKPKTSLNGGHNVWGDGEGNGARTPGEGTSGRDACVTITASGPELLIGHYPELETARERDGLTVFIRCGCSWTSARVRDNSFAERYAQEQWATHVMAQLPLGAPPTASVPGRQLVFSRAAALAQRARFEQIIEALRREPGARVSQVARAIGVTYDTALKYVAHLIDADVLEVRGTAGQGAGRRLYVKEASDARVP